MCGVAGIFNYTATGHKPTKEEIRYIRDFMMCRGPDGFGEWFSKDMRVGLGHRRLSIIDLSENAAQPMVNEDESLIITFNGEIYNYKEIRSSLIKDGYQFKSQSDTEVILNLYDKKGTDCLDDLRGMFAFVLWDVRKNCLFLARDPYGIKPLYYADDGKTIRAASQAKALLADGAISKALDPAGVVGFFLMGSVPEPYTWHRDIRALPAGCFMLIDENGSSGPKPYFPIPQIFTEKDSGTTNVSRKDALGLCREALLDSIRHHFVADVPVGIFLSAGMDSGTLVGLATDAGIKNLQTITLAFEEFKGTPEDEAPLAEEVARLYGTEHKTSYLKSSEFIHDLPHVFQTMDQPSIDGINTYFVSKIAAEQGLKVVLSGLGGDELFGSYPSFKDIPRIVHLLKGIAGIPLAGDCFRFLADPLISATGMLPPKLAGLVKYGGTYPGAYFLRRGLFMPWELDSFLDRDILLEGLNRLNIIEHIQKNLQPEPPTSFGKVASLESCFYMRNQLLRDADWAGMAHSVEIRTPWVDIFLARKLALILQQGLFSKKEYLSKSLSRAFPDKVIQRPKSGFGVPMGDWLTAEKDLSVWENIPLLRKPNCHWSRRWAYTVFNCLQY